MKRKINEEKQRGKGIVDMLDRDELAEKTGLSERILRDITAVAEKYQVERIILFGSRARGDFQKKSDIDLAIYGCVNFPEFSYDMEENVWTLLEFDLIEMNDEGTLEELEREIKRDGVMIYEKI